MWEKFESNVPVCLFFWPVRQSRAAVEQNLSLSQNTPHLHILIHLLSKQHTSHTPLRHISLVLSIQSKPRLIFLSSLAEWAQNSNFITSTGL